MSKICRNFVVSKDKAERAVIKEKNCCIKQLFAPCNSIPSYPTLIHNSVPFAKSLIILKTSSLVNFLLTEIHPSTI